MSKDEASHTLSPSAKNQLKAKTWEIASELVKADKKATAEFLHTGILSGLEDAKTIR